MKTTITPPFIYGTAWKEDDTALLVKAAVQAGFRAIDTANQRKHYHEAQVGEALGQLYGGSEGISRDQLFLQTKFTGAWGQDHRLPYDPKACLRDQVHQSFASSLSHLQTDYLDSYLLHGPHSGGGLLKEDWEVWKAMEELFHGGKTRSVGVSNINERQLAQLLEQAQVKPKMVQNRCFAQRGWDREVRKLCLASGIIYQGFSLLTANPFVMEDPRVLKMAKSYHKTPMQIVFRFATQVGMVPLTGTTDPLHMQEDLRIFDFDLQPAELETLDHIST